MSFTQTDTFARIWNLGPSSAYDTLVARLLAKGIDLYEKQASRIAKRIKQEPADAYGVERWAESEGYPDELVGTMASSGTSFTVTGAIRGVTATRANALKVAGVDTILTRVASGVTYQVKVTAVHATNPVLTVEAYGGTAAAPDGTTQTWKSLGPAWYDAKPADNPQILDRTVRWTSGQIFSETFEREDLRQRLKMELVKDETEYQVKALLKKIATQKANAIIHGRPLYDSGFKNILETQKPTLWGLYFWLDYLFGGITGGEGTNTDLFVDLSGNNIEPNNVNTLVKKMYLNGTDFESGDWVLWAGPNTYAYMQNYGFTQRRMTQDSKTYGTVIEEFQSELGPKFPMEYDRDLREDAPFLIDMSKLSWKWFEGEEPHRELLAKSGRWSTWQISCVAKGTKLREAKRSIGGFKNGKV